MSELTQKKIFDEMGDDSQTARQMINGKATGILNLNSVKYQWAPKLYKIMVNNFWIPENLRFDPDKIPPTKPKTEETKIVRMITQKICFFQNFGKLIKDFFNSGNSNFGNS